MKKRARHILSSKKQSLAKSAAFVFAIAIILLLGNYLYHGYKMYHLSKDSQTILYYLEGDTPFSFIHDDMIVETKLSNIADSDNYLKIKEFAGTNTNFCIYFEDENGQILDIKGNPIHNAEDRIGIGDEDLKINGVPCGTFRRIEG